MKTLLTTALLCSIAAVSPAAAATLDPAKQGPNAANFQYGYQQDGTSPFTVFDFATQYMTSGCPISGTTCYTGPASFLGVYFAPTDGNYQGADLRSNEITFHPGPDNQLIGLQFVAPSANTYTFTGMFRAADQPFGNGVTFNAGSISGVLGVRPASQPFSFTTFLAQGATTLFTIGNNGSFSNDTTGFSLSVTAAPEPTTWALMILGFGIVGTALRRRRGHASSKPSVRFAF